MRGKKAKAIRRMVRQLGGGEDVLMGDRRTARFFWKLPKVKNTDGTDTPGGILKTASEEVPVARAKPLISTFTAVYRPGGMKHLTRLTKRQLKEARNG